MGVKKMSKTRKIQEEKNPDKHKNTKLNRDLEKDRINRIAE